MNVYDFDKTIYDGDSTVDFYFFCLSRRPSVLRSFPLQLSAFARYGLKRISKTRMKEIFFSYLKHTGDVPALVEDFWAGHRQRLLPWYLGQKKPDDVIISASPEFLLRPVCQSLGVGRLIASRVAVPSGAFDGLNCYAEEKPVRFAAECPGAQVEEFYSDSLSDSPMAQLAQRSFLVHKNTRKPWPPKNR